MVDARPASVVAKSGIERLRIKESVAATIQWLLPGKHDTPLSGMQELLVRPVLPGRVLNGYAAPQETCREKSARTCARAYHRANGGRH